MSVVERGGKFSVYTIIFFFSSAISMNTFYSGAEIFIFFIVVVVFWKYTHHFLDFFCKILKITVYMVFSFFPYKYM